MSNIAVLVGSVYGAAIELAEHVTDELNKKGNNAVLHDDVSLEQVLAQAPSTWLIVTSTTGQGDMPDNIINLFEQLKDQFPDLNGSQFAVAAMGDSSYVDSYCGAGKAFDELMKNLAAKPMAELLEIDACETTDPVAFSQTWLDEIALKLA